MTNLPRPPLPVIDSSTYRLKDGQYVAAETKKNLIVLHHTVSSTASSPVNYWNQTRERIATAYVVDKDGAIYNVFDDSFWAYHVGSREHSPEVDARSIGIELVSEGGLVKVGDEIMWNYNPRSGNGLSYKGEYLHVPGGWRGYSYFAKYDPRQIRSLIELLDYLHDKHGIPRKMLSDLSSVGFTSGFEGVVSHAQIRKDKSDVHIGFPVAEVCRWAGIEIK